MRERIHSGMKLGVMMFLCTAGGAFVVGRMAPIAAALYTVCCLVCDRYLILYICSIGGIAAGAFGLPGTPYMESGIMASSDFAASEVFGRYVILLTCVLIIMKTYDIRRTRGTQKRGRQSGMELSGMEMSGKWTGVFPCAVAVMLAELVSVGDGIPGAIVRSVVAGILYICTFYIFSPGVTAIACRVSGEDWRREAGEKGYDRNQCIVSVMAIWSVILWLAPIDIAGGISLCLILTLFVMLYTVYRSGAEYGCGLAVAAGGILAVKMDDVGWIPWLMLVTISMLIGRVLSGHRRVVLCIFYVLGIALSMAASGSEFVRRETVEDIVFACVNLGLPLLVFASLPAILLGRAVDDIDPACLQAAATEINRMTSSKMEDMANTFRRLDYTFAGSDEPGISLSQVGELVDGFRRQIDKIGSAREISDEKLIGQMHELGMENVRVTEIRDECGRNRFYVAGCTSGQGMVLSRQVAETLSSYFEKNIRVGMNSPSLFFDDYRMAEYEESAAYRGMYHVRRIRKYGSPVSGDNFSVKEYEDGRLVMMLSDGMGSGSLASCESCMMLDTMEEMLEAGFSPEYSIAFSNRCMARKNQGRTFTTFDMVVIDMYDGAMTSFKQGASMTYVVHPGKDGNTVDVISSTTLPVGVLDEAECDVKGVSLTAGDAVIMVSDGISDIDMDGAMNRLLGEIHIGDSRRMVDEIIGKMLGQSDVSPRDDVTVMAVVIGRNDKRGAA